jgi:CheY-like chemotaxis protein
MDSTKQQHIPDTDRASGKSESPCRILVVDDNDQLATLIQKLLGRANHFVIRASDGEEALKLYNPNTIDVVLTDLVMPKKEGLELIRELRKINPDVRIVAMSGDGSGLRSEAYLKVAGHFGASCVLRKPFSSEELLAAVERVCSEQSPR